MSRNLVGRARRSRGVVEQVRNRGGVRQLLVCTLAGATIVGMGACSWTRFDDVQENAPVLLLKKPEKLKAGFGLSIATAGSGDDVRVLVGGAPNRSRGAAFAILKNQGAKIDAIDTGFCDDGENSNPCLLGSSVAGLGLARVPGGTQGTVLPVCFAMGIGQSGSTPGILVRCMDQTEYALAVPTGALNAVVVPALSTDQEAVLQLAADKDEQAALIAGAPAQTPPLAWFYPPDSMTPIELLPSANDASYGSSVASVRISGGRILAVGAPDQGHVYLFRWRDGEPSAALVGCLGGTTGFGRALVSGRVNADAIDELVISDDQNVHVIDGARLAELAPTPTPVCSLASLPEASLVASFSCGSDASISGCAKSEFGAALEVADLDGDGDGEVLVGAPRMKSREIEAGGAVLVYDVEGDRPFLLSDVLFLSSAEEGDQLGRTLAVARTGLQEFVVAGAPGNEKAALMFCSSFSTGLGPRCE